MCITIRQHMCGVRPQRDAVFRARQLYTNYPTSTPPFYWDTKGPSRLFEYKVSLTMCDMYSYNKINQFRLYHISNISNKAALRV